MTRQLLLIPILFISIISCQDNANVGSNVIEPLEKEKIPQVEVVDLRREEFYNHIVTSGKIMAREKTKLTFSSTGKINSLNIEEGQRVNKGDILATLDSVNIKLDLDQAEINYQESRMNYANYLLDRGYNINDTTRVIPKETDNIAVIRSGLASSLLALERAKVAYNGINLVAPYLGKIASIKASVYESTEGEVCTIIDDGVMKVIFSILESEIRRIKKGQSVIVSPYGNSSKEYVGSIITINPIIEDDGFVSVTATLNNENSELLDGQNAKVCIKEKIANQLVIPKSALVLREGKEVIFVLKDGAAQWVYVKKIMENSNSYVVESDNLESGDKIISKGNIDLAHQTKVEVVTKL